MFSISSENMCEEKVMCDSDSFKISLPAFLFAAYNIMTGMHNSSFINRRDEEYHLSKVKHVRVIN